MSQPTTHLQDATEDAPERPGPRRRRLVLATLAVAVVAALLVWLVPSRSAAPRVEVLPSAVTCDGRDVPPSLTGDVMGHEPPRLGFLMGMGEDATCDITVVVANRGPYDVRVTAARFPRMLPASEPYDFVVVRSATGGEPHAPADDHDGMDYDLAVFDEDLPLAAGSWNELTYTIRRGERPPECGGVSGVQTPTIDFTSSHGRGSAEPDFWFEMTGLAPDGGPCPDQS